MYRPCHRKRAPPQSIGTTSERVRPQYFTGTMASVGPRPIDSEDRGIGAIYGLAFVGPLKIHDFIVLQPRLAKSRFLEAHHLNHLGGVPEFS